MKSKAHSGPTQHLGIREKWRRKRGRVLVLTLVPTCLVTLAGAVLASVGDWKPVLLNYYGDLTVQSSYATDNHTNNRTVHGDTTNERQALRDTLSVGTLGYVYHPDLMIFQASGTEGRDQSRLKEDGGVETSKSGSYEGYDLDALFLRSKPYTLEFFSSMDKPFSPSAKDLNDPVTQESGLEFNYRQNPYRAKFQYKGTDRSGEERRGSQTDDYDLLASYIKPKMGVLDNFFGNVIARYQENQNLVDGVDTGGTTLTQAGVSNSFGYKMCDFATDLNSYSTTYDTQGFGFGFSQSQYSSDLFSVNENINIELPWNLTSRVIFGMDNSSDSNLWTNKKNESSRDHSRFALSLDHKLYESLNTHFEAGKESEENSRIDFSETGVSTAGPDNGTRERDDFGLSSRYHKRLPHESGVTASAYGRQTRNQNIGGQLRVFPSQAVTKDADVTFAPGGDGVPAGGGGQISVEVLPSDVCPATLNACWFPLKGPDFPGDPFADYEIIDERTLTIRIAQIANYQNLQAVLPLSEFQQFSDRYQDFLDPVKQGPLTFRVTVSLPPANYVVQTKSVGGSAGLEFLKHYSTDYQHSVTSQDLIAGELGFDLDPQVTEDRISFKYTWDTFIAGVAREWTTTYATETITEYFARYDQSQQYWSFLNLDFSTEAYRGEATTDRPSSESSTTAEDRYSYALSAGMPVPYLAARFLMRSSYSYSKGQIVRLAVDTYDNLLRPTQPFDYDQQTIVRNSVELVKPFKIPRIDFDLNSYVRYLWETTSGVDNKDTTRLQYGVNAGRAWEFGATSISFRLSYAITESQYDEQYNKGRLVTNNLLNQQWDEHDDVTAIVLKVTRRLF